MDRDEGGFLGKGLHFPMEVDEVSGRFKMSDGEENIRESIEIILKTVRGERAMQPDFGCNLKQFVYETMDYGVLVQMEEEVLKSLRRWEPRITDISVEAAPKAGQDHMLEIRIRYLVRVTNSPYNMVFPFYLQEGFGQQTG